MRQYLNGRKVTEGSSVTRRIKELLGCLERNRLFQIRETLKKEQFGPDQFLVVEHPTIGVYCCSHINDGKYFTI